MNLKSIFVCLPALLLTFLFTCPAAVVCARQMDSDTTVNAPTSNRVIDTASEGVKMRSDLSHVAPDPQRVVEANEFVLDTRNPSTLSLYNNFGNSGPRKVSRLRLEMRARQTSAFKIININPLHYNYYLNGQLVTQFMENNRLRLR